MAEGFEKSHTVFLIIKTFFNQIVITIRVQVLHYVKLLNKFLNKKLL